MVTLKDTRVLLLHFRINRKCIASNELYQNLLMECDICHTLSFSRKYAKQLSHCIVLLVHLRCWDRILIINADKEVISSNLRGYKSEHVGHFKIQPLKMEPPLKKDDLVVSSS